MASPNDTRSKDSETDVNWPYGLDDVERSWDDFDYRTLLKNGYELIPRLRP